MKDSTAVSENELAFYVPNRLQSEKCVFNVITQLVAHLPLMLLNRPESRSRNMHQIDFDCEQLDSLFKNRADDKAIPEAKQPTEKSKSGEGGRESILDRFPNIPDIATEFIKANGFKAQEKQRDTTITSCGGLVKDVKEHLCPVMPGLRKFGISYSTVRYLFKPVKKGTFAAECYKLVIDASVPQRGNSKHKDNIDAHYMLSRIKMGRELAACVRDESTVVSAGSMSKIRYGTMAVNPYHQIGKIFL